MRVLVLGSVPPPASERASWLLDRVLGLRAEGHEVDVVGLDHRSVSHRYLASHGATGVAEIALLIRRYDSVVLQLEPGLPVRLAAGRPERAACLGLLRLAIRRHPDVTLRLYHPDDLPGGPGGRIALEFWHAARRIEVGTERAFDEIAALAGADRVALVAGRALEALALPPPAWGSEGSVSLGRVQALVKERAAAERLALGRRGPLPGVPPGARVPQWQYLPSPLAGVPDLGPTPSGLPVGRNTGRSTSFRVLVRRVATRLLAAAERRPVLRPVAHLSRLAYIEARGALRRPV